MSSIEMILDSKIKDLGGFQVRRVLPDRQRRMVGPFIFLDHMGPAQFEAGQGIDVRPHPHIGLATVTWLFEGSLFHRDSLGSAQNIEPGAVNWMVAGNGIVHSERTAPEVRQKAHHIHGIQIWVALPDGLEEISPQFVHYPATAIPCLEIREAQNHLDIRVVAGEFKGRVSPVKTQSLLFYFDIQAQQLSEWKLPAQEGESAIYMVKGEMAVDGHLLKAGQLAVLRSSNTPALTCTQHSHFLMIGGEKLSERHIWWNFVASSQQKIEEAKKRWADQKFPPVPGELEFTPLPG